MDDNDNRIPVKYAYNHEMPQERIDWFEKTVKMWSSLTCLTFQKLELPAKEDDFIRWCYYDHVPKEERVAYIDISDSQSNTYGIPIGKEDNRCVNYKVSGIMSRGYNDAFFAQMLGLVFIPFRPDRNEYVSFNWEHLEILNDLSMMKFVFKCWGVSNNVPLPFDFLSIMSWHSYIWGTDDTVPVLVSRDPYQQYLLEYKNYQAPPTSPFDVQTLNMIYKCIPEWESACKASGKEVPKCKNFGYVTKECVCSCPPVYSGRLCENKIGTNFPYPLQEGAFNYTITSGGHYDLEKLLPIATPKDENLQAITFIIVKLEPRGTAVLPFISVRWNASEDWKKYIQDDQMDSIHNWDCNWGLRILWGSKNKDGARRLACECTSVLGFNEFKENARVLSARSGNMTLTFLNRLGEYFGSDKATQKQLAIESTKYILETQFREPPVLTPKQNRSGDVGTGGGGGGKAGNDTELPLTATAAAMTAAGGAGSTAAVIGAIAALVLLCLLLLLLMKRRKKKKKVEELGEEEEEGEDGSGSDED